jgi:hypothetical protein
MIRSQTSIEGGIWIIDLVSKSSQVQELKEGRNPLSKFVKREVPICKGEIRTIGSRGLWTVDLASGTHKFRFQKDEKGDNGKWKVMKHSRYCP